MTVIALTGGIASGKSTIGRRLAELGAVRIDADELARDAVAVGSPGLARVREQFGSEIIRADGSLDRSALGALVFGDREALQSLNAIVHPEVQRLAQHHIETALKVDSSATVVYEIPLLVENPDTHPWDLVVVADAPVEQRVQRMVDLRGMSEEDARARISNQASDEKRRAIADVIIDTSGTESETLAQVDELYARMHDASSS